MNKRGKAHESSSPLLCRLAESHPNLGYRRIWAKAQAIGYPKSRSSAYLELKREGKLFEKPSYKTLKAAHEARKTYLVKPTGINQLWQADFTQLHIPGWRVHFLFLVMDYFSRYLLVLRLFPTMAAQTLIDGLDQALEEAQSISGYRGDNIITLVTDNGPAMVARKFAQYIEMSPFYHIRGRSHHPQTLGMVERTIRSIKEEEIYIHDYRDPLDAQDYLNRYRYNFNHERPHQSLDYRVPVELYGLVETNQNDSQKLGQKWFTFR